LKTRKKINSSLDIINSPFTCIIGINRGPTIRISHVDDDACILRISKLILELTGAYQVETASSLKKQLAKWGKLSMTLL
jgi:hypothetical protein